MKVRYFKFLVFLLLNLLVRECFAIGDMVSASYNVTGLGIILGPACELVEAALYLGSFASGFGLAWGVWDKNQNIILGSCKFLLIFGIVTMLWIKLPQYFGLNI